MRRQQMTDARTWAWGLLAAAALAAAAACSTDDLLNVKVADRVEESVFNDPASATLMVNSVQSEFECAFGSAVTVEAIISDEFADAQLGAAGWPYDRRDANTQPGGAYGVNSCESNQTPGIYLPLSTARWQADNALTKLNGWSDAQVGGAAKRQALVAKAALYAGFSYAMMGMSLCNAAFDLGAPVDQKGMFALAEARFTSALAAAQGQTDLQDIADAAHVGRARVRLFQGNTQGAAADAALVPSGFVMNATYGGTNDNRRYNRVYGAIVRNGFYTVEAQSRNLTTEGAADPRAAVVPISTKPADVRSAMYAPEKYLTLGDPIRMATYDEAQLILAEVQGGAQAVAIINAMRDQYGLPHYTGATDPASIQQLIIEERRRALFVEGFRNYDMQRFNVAFNPPVGAAFPIKGGTYGNTRCLPLPDIERFNNPNVPAGS
jgi:starch-binding outer membrane protein, SusD/RagB family